MSTDDNLYVRGYSGINLQVNNGTTALGLASTGAATFSSTVATNGIIFPGTQVPSADANTLDDYEEGTWTMGISFGGASVGVTYGGSTGTYTKIGRQVTVNGYLLLSNKGSSTGTAKITGLPFTTLNSQSALSTCALWLNAVTFANQHQGVLQINSTNIELWETTEAGVATVLNDANFANNSEVIVNLTYFV
jgi:hypothetical protein